MREAAQLTWLQYPRYAVTAAAAVVNTSSLLSSFIVDSALDQLHFVCRTCSTRTSSTCVRLAVGQLLPMNLSNVTRSAQKSPGPVSWTHFVPLFETQCGRQI
jgi:hypothetical protein